MELPPRFNKEQMNQIRDLLIATLVGDGKYIQVTRNVGSATIRLAVENLPFARAGAVQPETVEQIVMTQYPKGIFAGQCFVLRDSYIALNTRISVVNVRAKKADPLLPYDQARIKPILILKRTYLNSTEGSLLVAQVTRLASVVKIAGNGATWPSAYGLEYSQSCEVDISDIWSGDFPGTGYAWGEFEVRVGEGMTMEFKVDSFAPEYMGKNIFFLKVGNYTPSWAWDGAIGQNSLMYAKVYPNLDDHPDKYFFCYGNSGWLSNKFSVSLCPAFDLTTGAAKNSLDLADWTAVDKPVRVIPCGSADDIQVVAYMMEFDGVASYVLTPIVVGKS